MSRIWFEAGNWGRPISMADPSPEQIEALMTLGCAPHSRLDDRPKWLSPSYEPDNWVFDVFTADHEAVMAGWYTQRRSRVTLSREEFPDSVAASEFAALLASSTRGGMPTSVLPVL